MADPLSVLIAFRALARQLGNAIDEGVALPLAAAGQAEHEQYVDARDGKHDQPGSELLGPNLPIEPDRHFVGLDHGNDMPGFPLAHGRIDLEDGEVEGPDLLIVVTIGVVQLDAQVPFGGQLARGCNRKCPTYELMLVAKDDGVILPNAEG